VHLEMLFTFFNCAFISFPEESQSGSQVDDCLDKPELHRKMINAAGKRIRDMNQAAKTK
jgi:hypothetical protein